jgi:hypothetical protein
VPHYPASSGRSVRMGARQSIASSSIESCAGVSVAAAPVDVVGHTKRPFSSLLANRHKPWSVPPENLNQAALPSPKTNA